MENQVQQKTFNAVSKVPSVIELKDKLLPLAKQFSTEIANLRTDEENRRLLMTFIFLSSKIFDFLFARPIQTERVFL